MTHTFVPILLMLLFAVVVAGTILGLNSVIGRHQRNPSKLAPYESGVPLLDQNRKRMNVRFYQIAMLFILFDIEAVFLYPWAVVFKKFIAAGLGPFILAEMGVFIVILFVGYIYVWKKGALEWE